MIENISANLLNLSDRENYFTNNTLNELFLNLQLL